MQVSFLCMFEYFLPHILKAMTLVSGQSVQAGWEEKARLALSAGVFLVIFSVLFFWFYRWHFWHMAESRRLFWWTAGLLTFAVVGKFTIYFFAKGYIPDRILFFGIPSPKFSGLLWLVPITLSLGAFWHWRERLTMWSPSKFLTALFFIFVCFSAGVAGLREGTVGVLEPFTRSEWEYAGALPLIESPGQFLHEYTTLTAKLPIHSQTHPPGYVLFLHGVSELFGSHPLTLSLAALLLGGLALIPLYWFLRAFASEEIVRLGLTLFAFFPSVVMYSATSMETALLFWSSATLAATVWGWRQSHVLSFFGGIFAALALFQNFLFFLLGPVFLFLFFSEYLRVSLEARSTITIRLFLSFVGFLSFFFVLAAVTQYSILENFFVARAVNSSWISSNFSSPAIYFGYVLLNLLAFSFGLGVANLFCFLCSVRRLLSERAPFVVTALAATTLFLAIGVFQGEVERIWLFLLPFYILPLAFSGNRRGLESKNDIYLPFLTLSVAQIIIIQSIFYTYW